MIGAEKQVMLDPFFQNMALIPEDGQYGEMELSAVWVFWRKWFIPGTGGKIFHTDNYT
jgi:hypothetical protein